MRSIGTNMALSFLVVTSASANFLRMGLFKKEALSPEEQQRRQQEAEKSLADLRAKFRKSDAGSLSLAKSHKFPAEGARMVLASGAFQVQCLVVRDDQVEYYTKETGSMHRSSGVQQQWIAPGSAITSVACEPPPPTDLQQALSARSTLSVVTSHGSMTIKGGSLPLDYCAELLREMQERAANAAPQAVPAAVGGASPREALKELASLFEDGLIDEDEFREKKAEILSRM